MNTTHQEIDVSGKENLVTLTDSDLIVVAGGNSPATPPSASKTGSSGSGKTGAGGTG